MDEVNVTEADRDCLKRMGDRLGLIVSGASVVVEEIARHRTTETAQIAAERDALKAENERLSKKVEELKQTIEALTSKPTPPDDARELVEELEPVRIALVQIAGRDFDCSVHQHGMAAAGRAQDALHILEAALSQPAGEAIEAGGCAPPIIAKPVAGDVVEAVAQFLHDEGGFDEAWEGYFWPEHDGDTGQRGDGRRNLIPSDVLAKFRDVAKRLLQIQALTAAPSRDDVIEPDGPTLRALRAISSERIRQVEVEGWTPRHDDHSNGDLAAAAGCYALNASRPWGSTRDFPMQSWPWVQKWWKPGGDTLEGRLRDLTKAGALIVAEMERIERALKSGEGEM